MDVDDVKPKARVIRKDGVWMAVRGMWKRTCSSHAEALRQAELLANKKMCVFSQCVSPQVQLGRRHLGLCDFHARRAAVILHWDSEQAAA